MVHASSYSLALLILNVCLYGTGDLKLNLCDSEDYSNVFDQILEKIFFQK